MDNPRTGNSTKWWLNTTRFLVRVELHEKTPSEKPDYNLLHEKMEGLKFVREIKIGGELLALPTAEYVISGDYTRQDVMDLAKETAQQVAGKQYSIIVVEIVGPIKAYQLDKIPTHKSEADRLEIT